MAKSTEQNMVVLRRFHFASEKRDEKLPQIKLQVIHQNDLKGEQKVEET